MKGAKKGEHSRKIRRPATDLPVHTCEMQAEKMWGQKMSELVTHTHTQNREGARGGWRTHHARRGSHYEWLMRSSLTIFEELSISQMDRFTHCLPLPQQEWNRLGLIFLKRQPCVSILSHPRFNICLSRHLFSPLLTLIAAASGIPKTYSS